MQPQPQLTRALVLEKPTRVSDGSGGFTVGWTVLGTHWADVKAGSGREIAGQVVAVARVPYRIIVRSALVGSSARPLVDQRFRDGARIFRILAVAETDPGGRYLTCLTDEEVVA